MRRKRRRKKKDIKKKKKKSTNILKYYAIVFAGYIHYLYIYLNGKQKSFQPLHMYNTLEREQILTISRNEILKVQVQFESHLFLKFGIQGIEDERLVNLVRLVRYKRIPLSFIWREKTQKTVTIFKKIIIYGR